MTHTPAQHRTRQSLAPQAQVRPRFRALCAVVALSALALATNQPAEAKRKHSQAHEAEAVQPLTELQGPRRTVAVARFTTLPQFDLAQGGPADVGGGLAAMLTTALVDSGRFLVVERPQLEDVFSEQQLSANRLVNRESRVEPGQLVGAQWLITGHVTELSESVKGGGFSIGANIGGGTLGISPKKRVGTVAMDVRVIDTTTGAVVSSIQARESVTSRSIGFSAAVEDVDLASSRFNKTSVGQAARRAIEQVVHRLAETLADTRWSGRIVEFDGGEVVVNAGAEVGIEVGQVFEITHQAKALTDPVTGEVLGYRTRSLGTARVTEVLDRVAFAEFSPTTQSALPGRNDVVTLVQ